MTGLDEVEEVYFPKHLYWATVAHARRKLGGRYLPGEEPERKAYGLIGARLLGPKAEVTRVFPLKRNRRHDPAVRPEVDRLMAEFAVRSETPLDRRGWVTDPHEYLEVERQCDQTGAVIMGGYHMHRVAWEHDPTRDTCTEIDRRLAEGSGLWMFILSMVDPEHPVLRTFFEGDNDHEAVVHLDHYV